MTCANRPQNPRRSSEPIGTYRRSSNENDLREIATCADLRGFSSNAAHVFICNEKSGAPLKVVWRAPHFGEISLSPAISTKTTCAIFTPRAFRDLRAAPYRGAARAGGVDKDRAPHDTHQEDRPQEDPQARPQAQAPSHRAHLPPVPGQGPHRLGRRPHGLQAHRRRRTGHRSRRAPGLGGGPGLPRAGWPAPQLARQPGRHRPPRLDGQRPPHPPVPPPPGAGTTTTSHTDHELARAPRPAALLEEETR